MSFAKQIVDKNSNASSPYDWKDPFRELLNDAFFGYSQHILGCRERDEQLVENASVFGMQGKKDSMCRGRCRHSAKSSCVAERELTKRNAGKRHLPSVMQLQASSCTWWVTLAALSLCPGPGTNVRSHRVFTENLTSSQILGIVVSSALTAEDSDRCQMSLSATLTLSTKSSFM